jgi:hypothetical protein
LPAHGDGQADRIAVPGIVRSAFGTAVFEKADDQTTGHSHQQQEQSSASLRVEGDELIIRNKMLSIKRKPNWKVSIRNSPNPPYPSKKLKKEGKKPSALPVLLPTVADI